MKKSALLLVNALFMALTSVLMAQEMPEVVPPTPEAASLGKFSEIPISHYTGLPNISVPIASFNVGDKSFPVSLSYHARGIQVSELASRVGIGWALNAGGQISRQVRDKPDENSYATDGMMDKLEDGILADFADVNYNICNEINNYIVNFNPPEPDRFPDVYNIQAGGISAKFIFDYTDNSPVLQKYDDLIISGSPGGDFVVTDSQGYVYTFGGTNAVSKSYPGQNLIFEGPSGYTQSGGGTDTTKNAWLLTSIEDPNGNRAEFYYQRESAFMYSRSYDEYSESTYLNHTSYGEKEQFQLSEIHYNIDDQGYYDKIVFEANDTRADVNADGSPVYKELDAIKLYSKADAQGGSPVFQLVKTFELYHSYMDSQETTIGNHHPTLFDLDPSASKRLVLDSIREVGTNGYDKPPYVFTYNGQTLPNRFSNSQDLWGYYNGANNGSFLDYFSNNRRVDTILSQAGMLEKITYPTGGSTRFTYEHNRGVMGPEYDYAWFPDINPDWPRGIGLSNLDNGSFIATGGIQEGYYQTTFTVNNRSSFSFSVSLPTWNGDNQNMACVDPPFGTCKFTIRLVPIVNGTPNLSGAIPVYSNTAPLWIDPGEYQLEVHTPTNWNPSPSMATTYPLNVALSWDDQVVSEDIMLYSAGKRISKIEFFDSGDNLVSQKNYDYNNSGIILSIPYFAIEADPNASGLEAYEYSITSALPGGIYSTYQGNTIGYGSVTEYYGDKDDNHGKTKYVFTNQKDTGDYTSPPLTPPTDNEWLRGLPISIEHYKKEGSSYIPVKKTYNSYLYGGDLLPFVFTPPSIQFNCSVNLDTNLDIFYYKNRESFRLPLLHYYKNNHDNINPLPYEYRVYYYTGGTLGNYTTTETLYDDNGNATLVTETKTSYDYDKHYQPAMVTSVTSDGIPIIQTYTYPQSIDFSNRTTEEQDLVDQNRMVVLETKTYRDDNLDGYPGFAASEELKNTTKTVYDWFAGGAILEPLLVQTAKGEEALQDRIEFGKYDDRGNLLEVSKTDGVNICYVYGYNGFLPVAKIENATYSQVEPYVTNIQNSANSDDDHCMDSGNCNEKNLRTALDALRNALPDAMVTTYTYDPLIGVTSMTDPKGYTVYYEYDGLNRLVRVKDADGNVMSENKYHYLLDN